MYFFHTCPPPKIKHRGLSLRRLVIKNLSNNEEGIEIDCKNQLKIADLALI